MKILTLILFIFSFNALATDYPAKHCELFVDKVNTLKGSHGSTIVLLFIKTLNQRLDSPIEEVGIRAVNTAYDRSGHAFDTRVRDERATLHYLAKDYYYITFNTAHNYGSVNITGSFYVKTKRGTYYWLHPAHAQDFVINKDTFNWIDSKKSFKANSYDPRHAIPTQGNEFSYFNPGNCY